MVEPSLPTEAKKAFKDMFLTKIRSISDSWYEVRAMIPSDTSGVGTEKLEAVFSRCTEIRVNADTAVNQNRGEAFKVIDSLPENLQAFASAQCADVQEILNRADDLSNDVRKMEVDHDGSVDQRFKTLRGIIDHILSEYKSAEFKAIENFE